MKKSQVEIRKAIAKRLKLARKKAGFPSAEDFCRQNNLELAHYLKQEEGDLSLIASEIKQYCTFLKIPVPYLVLGEYPENLKK